MFNLTDKVKLSNFYLTNYCGIEHLKDQQAEVVEISSRRFKAEDLTDSRAGREFLQLYVNRYGKSDIYHCLSLRIKFPSIGASYIVSEFGVELVK